MDIDKTIKSIRNLYIILSGKNDADVMLIYKGTANGIMQPWHIRVDARESKHETYDGAISTLHQSLVDELKSKVKSTEGEATRLRQALNQLGN
jgi:hypothetical protein